jgi:hypothetical protein
VAQTGPLSFTASTQPSNNVGQILSNLCLIYFGAGHGI